MIVKSRPCIPCYLPSFQLSVEYFTFLQHAMHFTFYLDVALTRLYLRTPPLFLVQSHVIGAPFQL